jgi:hypothetical protein
MLIEPFFAIVSVLTILVCCALQPTHARCPRGWYLDDGVRRSGVYTCGRDLVGDPNRDGTYGRPDISVKPPGEIWGRIYCTGGSHPIVSDDNVTVGCQR